MGLKTRKKKRNLKRTCARCADVVVVVVYYPTTTATTYTTFVTQRIISKEAFLRPNNEFEFEIR